MIQYDCIDNIFLGYTALLLSAHGGHLEIMKFLINQGSSVQEKDNNGKANIESILTYT